MHYLKEKYSKFHYIFYPTLRLRAPARLPTPRALHLPVNKKRMPRVAKKKKKYTFFILLSKGPRKIVSLT